VGQARQGGVRALGEGPHAQGVIGGLRQHRQAEVLEVAQAGVLAQLGVQDTGQQLDDTDEAQPRRAFLVIEPPRLHAPEHRGLLKPQAS
jgi:hypothetical protein